jgi:hypothetical protein
MIEISFSGTAKRLKPVHEISMELLPHYHVKVREMIAPEHFEWNNATGSDFVDKLIITVSIASPFLIYMKGYLVKKGIDHALKEVLFKPFLEWLENNKSKICLDELIFNYDDVQIRFACSKINHVNAVSRLFLSLTEQIPNIKAENIGDLKVISTPVFEQENKWYFGLKSSDLKLKDYLECWGLEFNHHRCVFLPESFIFIFNRWED